MPKTPQRVAFIGLGAMGFPMAARLAGDFSVATFDVSSERRTLAVDSGATIADSPAQASRDADVVGSEGRTCSGPTRRRRTPAVPARRGRRSWRLRRLDHRDRAFTDRKGELSHGSYRRSSWLPAGGRPVDNHLESPRSRSILASTPASIDLICSARSSATGTRLFKPSSRPWVARRPATPAWVSTRCRLSPSRDRRRGCGRG
jgi:hypothetical protein